MSFRFSCLLSLTSILGFKSFQVFKSIHFQSILQKRKMSDLSSFGYVDAHAHLIHEQFKGEEDEMAVKCLESGIEYVVVNGLEPISNREILDYSSRHINILPAMGIYPIDAMCNKITKENWTQDFDPPVVFNVDEEIAFIDSMASQKLIVALGECGLDRYYLDTPETNLEQERVLRELMRIAKKYNLPIILHTRKAEARVLEMLIEEGVKKADFHCFGGKVRNIH